MMSSIIKLCELLSEYGPVIVVVACLLAVNGFFIIRDWRRELRQEKRIDGLHDQMQSIIIPLVTECKEAVCKSTETIVQNSRLLARLTKLTGVDDEDESGS